MYISQFDPDGADKVVARLIAAGYSLRDFPDRGRPSSNGCRELTIVRPYIIRYEALPERVRILRIRHAAQLPIGE
ncbi:plasmid stabilization system protein ParE [Sphingomonas vulcanisoli]|uniref:Plasmid stabilization system protein ParE n=1 Tax=Sphingomonas vulcanisoli TaxID=1658060 RepID=A0ABX0TMX8_9SPHN|nr:type II toxin-antitoxin system RelE/ParE family toxin [Sphingomonas vulcanisoli]NIJ06879.1 plasmid stabilization system protein ParE [Sphingomonas vulcanisoli]